MDTLLPPEIINKIFQNLSSQSLKNVMLVCKKWKVIAEDPRLWTWCQITVENKNDLKKLNIRRLQWIESINLASFQPFELDVLLKRLEQLPKLKKITGLSLKNLSFVSPYLLAKVVNKLEYAEWCYLTNITSEQLYVSFRHMSEKTELLELKILNINEKLSNINPDIMASALNKLELLWMSNSLTAEQMNSIFNTMSEKTTLYGLCLTDVNISTTQPNVLAKAVNKLRILFFHRFVNKPYITDITASQAQSMFSIISTGTNLKMLEISTRQLPTIEPLILARAINKLEDVSLLNSQITTEQAQAIFKQMAEETQLKSLKNLRHNLSMIPANIFGNGLRKLEEVSLRHCNLNKEQVLALFLGVSTGSQLKILDLSFNNLSSVEPYYLARGVNMFEDVTLTRTFLTCEQINTILRVFLEEDTKMEMLSLELTDIGKADPELVLQARKKFQES